MRCSDGPRRHTADEAAGSAIYGCGYNSCGYNSCCLRSGRGRFGAGLGFFGPRSGSKSTPNFPDRTGPRTTSNCSHMSCSHIRRSPTGAAADTISRPLLKPVGVKESFTFC